MMEKLQLNQMEKLNGGRCENALESAGLGLSGSGLIFAVSAVAVAATPVGWGLLALAAASTAVGAASCLD